METDDGQEKYLKQYIQRQESLLLDFIRKNADLEIRVINLNASLTESMGKYEESQKQVEIQNSLMQQAANSVERLTIENKKYEKSIEDLRKSLTECRNELSDSRSKSSSSEEEINLINARIKELKEEYNRQTAELSELFKENQELKSKLPINKTKVKKTVVTLPPDEF